MLELAKKALGSAARRLGGSPLSSTARHVRAERLTYLTKNRLQRLEQALARLVRDRVPGDFLEFGVALGGSAIIIAEAARRDGRAFHGFDVFGMIPPPTSSKDGEKAHERYEVIASGKSEGIGGETYYGYRNDLHDQVVAAFARHNLPVDSRKINLHKGLFEETWPAYAGEAVAFAHIDCDWYDPVRFCLTSVASRLSAGGLILLDDYHDYGGCRTATDEFLAENPAFALEDGENVRLRKRPA